MKKVMSLLAGFYALLACMPGIAQADDLPAYHFDHSVRAYTTSSAAILVKEIITPNQTERQKITSIFRWMTDNISYNVKAAGRNKNSYRGYEEPEDDTARVIKPLTCGWQSRS